MAKANEKRRRAAPVRLGVIGGSGLYAMPALENAREVRVKTPFGPPSDSLVTGTIAGTPVAFLPRHGRGHRLLPGEINFRANLWALKSLGAERLLSVGAVGSLRDDVHPGDVVVPDQFLDRTRGRPSTFFGEGIVAHVAFGDPVCAGWSGLVAEAAASDGARVHRRGTYVCIEGPHFSTRAESNFYRERGGDVIGMTNLQEAKLAREAEICFASLSLVTDYDCWKHENAEVEIAEVLRVLAANVERAQRIIASVAARLPEERGCGCASALENAIVTDPARIPRKTRKQLEPIVGKYLSGGRS